MVACAPACRLQTLPYTHSTLFLSANRGAPSREVYVGGVRGLETEEIEEALWEYGAIQSIETAQGAHRRGMCVRS